MEASDKQRLAEIACRAEVDVEHVEAVFRQLVEESDLSAAARWRELEWFYCKLGLGEVYFKVAPPQVAARHLQALAADKVVARTTGHHVDLRLEAGASEAGMYACRDDHYLAIKIERYIERHYPEHGLHSYRSHGATKLSDKSGLLQLYVLLPPEYATDAPASETDIAKIADKRFLALAGNETKARYQRLIDRASSQLGPAIQVLDRPDKGLRQLLVAYRRNSTHSYFSALSDVLESHHTGSIRKYIEQFANGITLYSVYVPGDVPLETVESIASDLSLLYVLPDSSLNDLFRAGHINARELLYAYAAWKFTHQFLSRYSTEYASLAAALEDDPVRRGLLATLKHRLTKDTFTEDRLHRTLVKHPQHIKALYEHFARLHDPSRTEDPVEKGALEALRSRLGSEVSNEIDAQVLLMMLSFNSHILATNFYKPSKVALSFRLDPSFLQLADYPDTPYGIYFFVGSEFRGFHIRFRDVARGGVRIIRCRDGQTYRANIDLLFNENYNLAHTQQRKNKDIPEGGSKGTILLPPEHSKKAANAFRKYVDSMLDLLLPTEQIRSRLEAPEILFLGPDEGTAELMDWASQHARERGYPYWKAFTTGKSLALGGIPHDAYGMTTRSVHQYVVGVLEKLGLDETTVTKCQTGGPDGDLGSNEILISHDLTLTVIDGSGVAHDPRGLDRAELIRLARARLMVREFARDKLSKEGFVVTIEERDIRLPDGTTVESGLAFRNGFHLDPRAKAQLFVPCGGRPNAVHINNVQALLDKDGRSRFSVIVEGANLFFTQPARQALEKAGAIVFKDASANKGGVTSSSLEVLAALSLDDETFSQTMVVHDDKAPEFYQRYVEQVQVRIEQNARAEFLCLWREAERTRRPRSVLSDELSLKINALNDSMQKTASIIENPLLRARVFKEAIPQVLQEKISVERLLRLLPENYIRAVVGAHLASQYVYAHGFEADEIHFVEFLRPYLA